MITTRLSVLGMTCQNCIDHVTEELNEIPGVLSIDIELGETGESPSTVRVTSEDRIDDDLLEAAIDEAGYEVVPHS